MIDRIIIVAALVVIVVAAVAVTRWRTRRRFEKLQEQAAPALLETLGVEPDGRAIVVAFSSPGCAACHTAQAPALRALESTFSELVRVVPIDLSRRPEVADTFGILTVPATVVLGNQGQVLAANHGFAPLPRLTEQVQLALTG